MEDLFLLEFMAEAYKYGKIKQIMSGVLPLTLSDVVVFHFVCVLRVRFSRLYSYIFLCYHRLSIVHFIIFIIQNVVFILQIAHQRSIVLC